MKQQLLDEARNAPLNFEVQPWRSSSISKGRTVELLIYDFGRQAYLAQFSQGTARQITPNMLVTSSAEPAKKYASQFNWFHMGPDQAESIGNRFGQNKRRFPIYLHYRFKAVSVLLPVASRPTPVVEFEDDRLELYALPDKKAPIYARIISIWLPSPCQSPRSV